MRTHWLSIALFIVCIGLLVHGADGRTVFLARNSLLFALSVTLLSVGLGTGVALLAFRTNLPQRRLILSVWFAFLFVPLYLEAAAWDAGFGQLGWYSTATNSIATPWLRGWPAAIWVQTLASLPWVILIVGMALRHVEPELEDDARLCGSTWWVVRKVTLRRALFGVAGAAVWVAVTASSDMTVTDLYQVRTLAEELYTNFAISETLADTPGLWPTLWFTGILMILIAGILQRLADRPFATLAVRPRLFELGRWRWFWWTAMIVLLLSAICVPLGNLVYQAGLTVHRSGDTLIRTWSWERFIELVLPIPGRLEQAALWRFQREFGWTFLLGVSVATLSVTIAAPLGWWARRGGIRAGAATVAVAAGLATPGPLSGLAVIWLFTRGTAGWYVWLYDQTIAAPLVALVWRSLPLAILICWFSALSVPRQQQEAARLDGMGPVRCFLLFGVRRRKLVLATAWLVCLALASGELAASILVVPPGVMTLPIRVFNLMHAGVNDQVAAICLWNVLMVAVIGLVIVALGGRIIRHVARES